MRREKRQEANNTPKKSKIFGRANEGMVTTLQLRATKECMDRQKSMGLLCHRIPEDFETCEYSGRAGRSVFFFFNLRKFIGRIPGACRSTLNKNGQEWGCLCGSVA